MQIVAVVRRARIKGHITTQPSVCMPPCGPRIQVWLCLRNTGVTICLSAKYLEITTCSRHPMRCLHHGSWLKACACSAPCYTPGLRCLAKQVLARPC